MVFENVLCFQELTFCLVYYPLDNVQPSVS